MNWHIIRSVARDLGMAAVIVGVVATLIFWSDLTNTATAHFI